MLAPALVCAAPRGCAARRGRSRPAARSGSSCRSTRPRRACRDKAASAPAEPCACSSSIAPKFSSGHSAQLMQAEFHISTTGGAATAAVPGRRDRGRMAAPSSRPRHSGRRLRGNPGGVRTTPFSRTLPMRSAGWFSGSSSAAAKFAASPRIASASSARSPASSPRHGVDHKAHFVDRGGVGHGGSLGILVSQCGLRARQVEVISFRLASAASAARRPVS